MDEVQATAAALRLLADQVEAGGVAELELRVKYHAPDILLDLIAKTFDPPESCSRCRPIAIVTTPQRIRRDVADQLAGGMLVTKDELTAILAVLAAGDQVVDDWVCGDAVRRVSLSVLASQRQAVRETLNRFVENAKAAIGR